MLCFLLSTVSFAQQYHEPGVAAPTWQDAVGSIAALPPTGNNLGDIRLETTTFGIYAWDGAAWVLASGGGGGGGTVTSASVVTANGFSGSVANATTTPAITLSTTVAAGLIKSTGSAFVAAISGTDYQPAGNYITSLTSDVVAAGPGAAAATIQTNVVTNSKLAQVPTNTIKGNNTGSTSNVLDLTAAQVNTMLGTVTSVSGTAPVMSSGGATPAISMPVSTNGADGYLSAADHTTFSAKQDPLSFVPPLVNTALSVAINGSVADDKLSFAATADATKLLNFDLSGETTGKTLTIAPQNTSNLTLHVPQPATAGGAGMALVQDETTGFIFGSGITSSIGAANSMMQLANATTANRAQIKLHSYFNGNSVAGVSTLTSRSGTIAVNAAVVAGQDYSAWTAQAGATTPGSAPISGFWAFKANTVNALTVTSDFHLQLTNLAGTRADRFYLTSEGLLQLPGYGAGYAKFDASGNISSSATISPTDIPLTTNHILVGSAGGLATDVAMSNDAAILASGALTIQTNVISNAKLAQAPTLTLKGNNTGGTANESDLTVAQVNTMLGTVTNVTGTAPVVSSGGATPAISMAAATNAVNGYLTAADHTTFSFAASKPMTVVNNAASPYTVAPSTDYDILVDTSGGAVTINAPAAAGNTNYAFRVKKIAGAAAVTVASSDNIDGAGTFSITVLNSAFEFKTNGATFYVY